MARIPDSAKTRQVGRVVVQLDGGHADLRLLEVAHDGIVEFPRIQHVGRGGAVELAPGEALDADARAHLLELDVDEALVHFEARRVVLEHVDEVEGARMSALIGAPDAALQGHLGGEVAHEARVQAEPPERPRALAGGVLGADDREALDEAVDLEPRREACRSAGGAGDAEDRQQREAAPPSRTAHWRPRSSERCVQRSSLGPRLKPTTVTSIVVRVSAAAVSPSLKNTFMLKCPRRPS